MGQLGDDPNDLPSGLYGLALDPSRLSDFAKRINAAFDDNPAADDSFRIPDTHLEQAIAVAELMISREAMSNQRLETAIANSTNPALALDPSGALIEINALARSRFDVSTGASDFLSGLSDASRAELSQWLGRIKRDPGTEFTELHSLTLRDSDEPMLVCLSNWNRDQQPAAILVQAVGISWPQHLTAMVCRTYALTETEAEIFSQLAEGHTAKRIATLRGRSLYTIRAQIRDLYTKIGVTNQLQFLRLATGLASLVIDQSSRLSELHDEPFRAVAPSFPRPEHWRSLALPDGRQIDVAVFGPETGSPVLYFHNELFGDVLPASLVQAAFARGFRFILPARPWYRGSSGYPDGAFRPTQTANDFANVLDQLGIGKVSILAQTLGSMYALEFTHLYPERVTRLVAVSPMLPFGTSEHRRKLPDMRRFLSTLIHRSPRLLDLVGRVGHAYSLREGTDWYIMAATGNLPCDRWVFEHPVYRQQLRNGASFGLKNGYRSFVEGFRDLVVDPVDKLKALSVPFHVVIGDKERNTRMSRAVHLRQSGVILSVVTAKDGGEMLPFTHPSLIADTLVG